MTKSRFLDILVPQCVDDDELVLLAAHQLQHLVKLGGEQVEAGDDTSVGAELVLFHHLFVVDSVPDVRDCNGISKLTII